MTEPALPAEFLELLESVEAKRPRTVIDHILAHGYVTTEDLKERYGYNHPPRAARDVRELGIHWRPSARPPPMAAASARIGSGIQRKPGRGSLLVELLFHEG